MNISVLGCGRWGGFIAWYLNKTGHKVLVWGKRQVSNIEELKKTRTNELITFEKDIILTHNLEEALNHSKVVVISISSQALRSFLEESSQISKFKDKIIILCMKGLEESTGKRLSQIVEETLSPTNDPVIWVGPGHVQDITSGVPTCMIIDSNNEKNKLNLAKELSGELIKIYIGTDMIGNEIGAAAKNVIGIAAGILDGLDCSSLKGTLMSRGVREISRLILASGGKSDCAYGLAHLGDYQATLFSLHGNNRKFGESLVKNKKFDKLCEGICTTNALLKLSRNLKINLPICESVKLIIEKKLNPNEILSAIFPRNQQREF
ncbi:MAG: NAD(P)H-dependent glycerol-3-phosphate dehydrogenase [Oscillospiraceae bacterium]|jgi:glycerol-3-phosphate dehydrogenase (NAD(P)+)|nr:NAD(P)H-dependent glycerol-3-phosphate dehydrogenase [Oscillospiraceae bacterium]